jgi:ABC-2 type transport system permease protein
MSNVLAIAQKELRSYFASPIAYVVLAAFAVVFGFFYKTLLDYFVLQSMQMGGMMGSGGPVNVNQMLIAPLLQNAAVVVLFLLPMITMRTYAEEKRTGTIELLLTSPVSDVQIILAKFLGAFALYVVMLGVTLLDILLLFHYGNPEWRPVATGYLGMLLLGGCFIAVGLLISSLTKNQIIAGTVTFVVFLMLWVMNWMTDFTSSTVGSLLNYVSITSHLNDFARGVIDTKHVIYYLSFITFGLFLTYKAVDSERWRG